MTCEHGNIIDPANGLSCSLCIPDAEVEAALHAYYPGCEQSQRCWKDWAVRGGHDHFSEMRSALEAAAAVRNANHQ